MSPWATTRSFPHHVQFPSSYPLTEYNLNSNIELKLNCPLCSSELVISSDATCLLSPSSGGLLDLMYKDGVKSEGGGAPLHPSFHHMVAQASYHGYEQFLASAQHTWSSDGTGGDFEDHLWEWVSSGSGEGRTSVRSNLLGIRKWSTGCFIYCWFMKVDSEMLSVKV